MSEETKKFRLMTDDEIITDLAQLAQQCEHSNNPKETFKSRAKQELECPYMIAISFSSPNRAGQRMHMGMVSSPTTVKTFNF